MKRNRNPTITLNLPPNTPWLHPTAPIFIGKWPNLLVRSKFMHAPYFAKSLGVTAHLSTGAWRHIQIAQYGHHETTLDCQRRTYGRRGLKIDRYWPGTSTSRAHQGKLRNTECQSIGLLTWIPPSDLCCHTWTSSALAPSRPLRRPCSRNCPPADSEAQQIQRCPPSWLFTFGEQLTDNTSLSANHSAPRPAADLHETFTRPAGHSTPSQPPHS